MALRKQSPNQLRVELEVRLRKLVTICAPHASEKAKEAAVQRILKIIAEKIVAAFPVPTTNQASAKPSKPPLCGDCNVVMNPFAAAEGTEWVEGFSCDDCGWSFDTYRGKPQ